MDARIVTRYCAYLVNRPPNRSDQLAGTFVANIGLLREVSIEQDPDCPLPTNSEVDHRLPKVMIPNVGLIISFCQDELKNRRCST